MSAFRKFITQSIAFAAGCLMMCCSGVGPGGRPVLVTGDWLQDHLNDPGIVLLHSGSAEGFDSLHIPGARLIVPSAFTINSDTLHIELPAADSVVELLKDVGVNDESRIIIYYENARLLSRTTRVYVTLDFLGLGSRTSVLNGGLPQWMEEGRETTDRVAEFPPGNLGVIEPGKVVITAGELDMQRWSHDIVVIDARTPDEYYGTPGTADGPATGGHVEGACSLPYQRILADERPYLFRTDRELEELFRKAGMDRHKTTVVYCGSGVRASVSYVAAKQLQYPVLLYDGSYEEWQELDLPLTGPVAVPDQFNTDTDHEE